jgi:CRISPR-associated endoribonuclease Cas6
MPNTVPPPDLISLLRLQPLESPPASRTPDWWGRAAQNLLLKTIQASDAQFSSLLHEPPGVEQSGASSQETLLRRELKNFQATRPFTTSSLAGKWSNGRLSQDETYLLRLTGLHSSVSSRLLQAVESGPLQPGAVIELDYVPFRVTIVHSPFSPLAHLLPGEDTAWIGQGTYAGLSAPFLSGSRLPEQRIGLILASPTSFKSAGKHVPLPLPGLVFGSLLERWNAFSPVFFPADLKAYAEENLAVSRYQLESIPVKVKQGGMRVGAVGQIVFACLDFDPYLMSLAGILSEFCLYSGLGIGTSSGMGQARRLLLE